MSARKGDELSPSWCQLVPHLVPEPMVAVIEALMWMQQPLSASEIAKLFGEPKHYYAGRASYYLKALRDLGLLEVTSVRPNRGALEHFFYFTEPK